MKLNTLISVSRALLVLGILAVSAAQVRAVTVNFSEPSLWTVGDVGTTKQQWLAGGTSASPINAPANLTHVSNPGTGTPALSWTGGAFVASSGGLYSFSANYNLLAEVDNIGGPGLGTTIIVQTAATVTDSALYDPQGDLTAGSVIRDSIQIRDADGNVLTTSAAVDVTRQFYDPNYPLFGGVGYEELKWTVFIPGYTGDFDVAFTEMIHSSLQAVRIDSAISPVPEPSSMALLAVGAVLPLAARWARRRRATVQGQ